MRGVSGSPGYSIAEMEPSSTLSVDKQAEAAAGNPPVTVKLCPGWSET